MWLAEVIQPPRFSWPVALVMLVVLVSSAAVFWALVHRWTIDQQRAALVDWSRQHGFVRQRSPAELLAPLDEAMRDPLRVVICLRDDDVALMQLEGQGDGATPPPRWNALIAAVASPWKPTALRPTGAPQSLLDLVSLSSYPLMGETDRFVIFGTETASARRLSKSHARGLLPADIGLLLHGPHLVLDFSSRPFDPIEFERMIALAEQLVAQLPLSTQ